MRWTEEPEPRERIKTWFALIPVTIESETRWLETVYVFQDKYRGPFENADGSYFNVMFVDENTSLKKAIADDKAETARRMKLR